MGRRLSSDFCRGESALGSVVPLDSFRSPIIFVVVNVGPLCLFSFAILLNARGQMDSVLLFQFFVGQVFCGRLGGG